MMAELGMVTPPVAIHVYVVQGVTKVPMVQIFLEGVPFRIVYFIAIEIRVAFPGISLFLPRTMKDQRSGLA
jgi:TRAP-type C4-dicarboxylate transport system permease large subunit